VVETTYDWWEVAEWCGYTGYLCWVSLVMVDNVMWNRVGEERVALLLDEG